MSLTIYKDIVYVRKFMNSYQFVVHGVSMHIYNSIDGLVWFEQVEATACTTCGYCITERKHQYFRVAKNFRRYDVLLKATCFNK